MSRRLSVDALGLSASAALGQLLMAAVIALAGRSLGPEGLATIAVSLSVAAFLNGMVDFGANYLMLREVSAGRLSHEQFGSQIWSKMAVGAVIALVLAASNLLIPAHNFSGPGTGVIFLSLACTMAMSITVRAAGKNVRLAMATLCDRLTLAVSFLVLAYVARIDARIAFFIGYGLGAVIDCGLCVLATPAGLRPRPGRPTLDPWRGSHYFGLSAIAQNAASLDTTIASALAGGSVAGSYGGVNRWTQPVGLATNAFTTVLFPVAAAERDARSVWLRIRRSMWLPAAAFLMAAGLALLAPWFVPLVLGPKFRASIPALQWLCVSAALGTVNQVSSSLLQARGRERLVARTMIVGVAVQLLLLIPFVPRFGAAGVAMAAAFSQLVFLTGFMLIAKPRQLVRTIRKDSQ